MTRTIKEMVYSNVSPAEVFETFYGLNSRERKTYETILAAGEPLSVETIAERMDCSLSTAYRYVDALGNQDLIEETGLYDREYLKSGYTAKEPALIAQDMQEYVEFKYQKCQENIEGIGNGLEDVDCEEQGWDKPGTFMSQ